LPRTGGSAGGAGPCARAPGRQRGEQRTVRRQGRLDRSECLARVGLAECGPHRGLEAVAATLLRQVEPERARVDAPEPRVGQETAVGEGERGFGARGRARVDGRLERRAQCVGPIGRHRQAARRGVGEHLEHRVREGRRAVRRPGRDEARLEPPVGPGRLHRAHHRVGRRRAQRRPHLERDLTARGTARDEREPQERDDRPDARRDAAGGAPESVGITAVARPPRPPEPVAPARDRPGAPSVPEPAAVDREHGDRTLPERLGSATVARDDPLLGAASASTVGPIRAGCTRRADPGRVPSGGRPA